MSDTVIAVNSPHDGRNWDCQCARCGASMDWEECSNCGGDGLVGHDCGEDTCCCMDPEENVVCDICDGEGGWQLCMSGYMWCLTHPNPGRLYYPPHTPEWYTLERRATG